MSKNIITIQLPVVRVEYLGTYPEDFSVAKLANTQYVSVERDGIRARFNLKYAYFNKENYSFEIDMLKTQNVRLFNMDTKEKTTVNVIDACKVLVLGFVKDEL